MRGTGRRLLLCAMVLGVISGLCTGAGTAWASQAVLEGHVVDSFRAPVAGVQVHIWDGRATHTAVTNAEGMFSLVGLTMDRDLSVRWVRTGQRDVRLDGWDEGRADGERRCGVARGGSGLPALCRCRGTDGLRLDDARHGRRRGRAANLRRRLRPVRRTCRRVRPACCRRRTTRDPRARRRPGSDPHRTTP